MAKKLPYFGVDITKVIMEAPIPLLLTIGKRVSSTDFSIRFYNNKHHPKFYKQDRLVKKAVLRAWSEGPFNHRQIIIRMLQEARLLPLEEIQRPLKRRNIRTDA